MTFAEWYEEAHGQPWYPDYADTALIEESEANYSTYCHENDLEPIWNG